MKTGIFVGRFQPFHKGHFEAVKYALKEVDRLVIVVGSAQKSHEPNNPFTAGERIEMIWRTLKKSKFLNRVLIIPVPDVENHNLWVPLIDSLVPKYSVVFSNDPLTLELFKEKGVDVKEVPLKNRKLYMATEIRRRIVSGVKWEDLVPEEVAKFLKEIKCESRLKMITLYEGQK